MKNIAHHVNQLFKNFHAQRKSINFDPNKQKNKGWVQKNHFSTGSKKLEYIKIKSAVKVTKFYFSFEYKRKRMRDILLMFLLTSQIRHRFNFLNLSIMIYCTLILF